MEPETSNSGPRQGTVERWRLFLSEVRNELKRVTWPSRHEVYATTVVVILTSFVLGLYLWGLDLLSEYLVFRLMRWFGAR